jgi:hypothetical protein
MSTSLTYTSGGLGAETDEPLAPACTDDAVAGPAYYLAQ